MLKITLYSSGDIFSLKNTLKYIKKHVKYNGQIYIIVYDDFVGIQTQEECRDYIRECDDIDQFSFSLENEGITGSRCSMYDGLDDDDIILSFDHDLQLLKDIDVAKFLDLFARYDYINQIKFSRRDISNNNIRANDRKSEAEWVGMFNPDLSLLKTKQIELEGIPLIPVAGFSSGGPAFSRVSFIKNLDPWRRGLTEVNFNKEIYYGCKVLDDVEKLGMYKYGKFGDSKFCLHTRAEHVGLWRR